MPCGGRALSPESPTCTDGLAYTIADSARYLSSLCTKVTSPRFLLTEWKSSADGIKFGHMNTIVVVRVACKNFIFLHKGTSH
jgi:hypothetical protein